MGAASGPNQVSGRRLSGACLSTRRRPRKRQVRAVSLYTLTNASSDSAAQRLREASMHSALDAQPWSSGQTRAKAAWSPAGFDMPPNKIRVLRIGLGQIQCCANTMGAFYLLPTARATVQHSPPPSLLPFLQMVLNSQCLTPEP